MLRSRLQGKTIHGVYRRETEKPGCNRRATHPWLKDGKLQAVTEGLIFAAQDGVIQTAAYKARTRKSGSQTCRACGKGPETIGHLLSRCEMNLWNLIKERHNRVLYQLTKAVAEAIKVRLPKRLTAKGGRAKPGIFESKKVTLMIDQCIPTKRETSDREADL